MLHIPETTQWLPVNTPAMLEMRGPLLLPEVARELGLHEGQVVEAVVRVRGERMELFLNGRTIEVPPGWRLNAGQVVWVTAHATTQGQLVLRQFRTPEQAARHAQAPGAAAPGAASPAGAAKPGGAGAATPAAVVANTSANTAPVAGPAVKAPVQGAGAVQTSAVAPGRLGAAADQPPLPVSVKPAVIMRAMPAAASVLERGGVVQVPEFRADATSPSAWASRLQASSPAPAVITMAAMAGPVPTRSAATGLAAPNVAAALWSHTPPGPSTAVGPKVGADGGLQLALQAFEPKLRTTATRDDGVAMALRSAALDPVVGAPLRQLLQHPPGMSTVMTLMQPQVMEVLLRTPGLMQWAISLAQRQVSMRKVTEADVRRGADQITPTEAKLLQGHKVDATQDLKQVLVQMLRSLRQTGANPLGTDSALLRAALNDVESAQLDSVRAQQQAAWTCQFVLPFSDGPAVHLKFKRSPVAVAGQQALWWVNMYTQSQHLGEVWMRSGVSPTGEVDMHIWATRPEVAADARARANELRDWLDLADLNLAQLVVTDGAKPVVVNQPVPHGSVLDAQA
jgi:hypothetical protein